MNFSITLTAFEAEILSGEPKPITYTELRWMPLDEMSTLAFSAPQTKVLKAVFKSKQKTLFND
jgi:hypothetical protein